MKYLVFFLALLVSLPLSTTRALAGTRGGNGGDPASAEWVQMGYRLAEYLELKAPGELTQLISGDEFRSVVGRTIVERSDQPLSSNGIPKDAINYPDDHRIVFYTNACQNCSDLQSYRFVFHEYLEVSGFEHEDYRISKLLNFYVDRDLCFEGPCPGDNLKPMRDLYEKSGPLDMSVFGAKKSVYVNGTQKTLAASDAWQVLSDVIIEGGDPVSIWVDASALIPQIGVSTYYVHENQTCDASSDTYTWKNTLRGSVRPVTYDGSQAYIVLSDTARVGLRMLNGNLIFRAEGLVAGIWRDAVYGYVDLKTDQRNDLLSCL